MLILAFSFRDGSYEFGPPLESAGTGPIHEPESARSRSTGRMLDVEVVEGTSARNDTDTGPTDERNRRIFCAVPSDAPSGTFMGETTAGVSVQIEVNEGVAWVFGSGVREEDRFLAWSNTQRAFSLSVLGDASCAFNWEVDVLDLHGRVVDADGEPMAAAIAWVCGQQGPANTDGRFGLELPADQPHEGVCDVYIEVFNGDAKAYSSASPLRVDGEEPLTLVFDRELPPFSLGAWLVDHEDPCAMLEEARAHWKGMVERDPEGVYAAFGIRRLEQYPSNCEALDLLLSGPVDSTRSTE